MKTLIQDPVIVTMNERNEVIDRGDIVVDGNRIAYVGPAGSRPPGPVDKVVDAGRMIAMPGMINAHCHSPANLVRGMMPSKPLEIWRAYYRASLRGMREEDFYASALLGGMEMLKNGATTVLDHFAGDPACRFMGAGAAVQAMRDLGLRHIVALTLTDKNYQDTIPLGDAAAELAGEIGRMSASEAKSAKAWLDECAEFIDSFHAPEKLTTACPGPSAVQRCTNELLGGAAEMAAKKGLPLHLHLAETKAQAAQGRTIYGRSLLRHLDSLGIVRSNLSCAHSIWIEDEDVALFASRGATPVHNPASNLRIGSGLARIKEFLAAGINVALGTDGSASNDGQNMFDAARLAALIHNQPGSDFNQWVAPIQALAMATKNGARAFALNAGALEAGRLADLLLLRRDAAAFTPLNDVVGQIVFCQNGSDVDTVLVNGEIVVERGRCTQVDEAEILARAIKARDRLDPSMRRELAAASTMEPALAQMYFKVFGANQ